MRRKAQEFQDQPGLIMIQIDGFSKSELAKALERNEMPFLDNLIKNEKYRLHALYTGLPSTTPSVQGELFYGVKQCVPSFFFFDKLTQKIFRMFDGDAVRAVEGRLAQQGEGLLTGGSSYSNIFSGGAKETHFCSVSLGWRNIWKDVNFAEFVLLIMTHFGAFLRMLVLCLWETLLAIMDFIYGLIKREDLIVESKFVPLRILLCILLREVVTLGVTLDIARGLPIIHLNFLGYDEQAHRRGPGSPTAHWALKGIDKVIARIYATATHSSKRHYDVWVYSDHGQEATMPYVGLYGEGVEEAVAHVFHRLFPHQTPLGMEHELVVAAMGPVGGVYLATELSMEEKAFFAQELVRSAKIPLVLIPQENGKVQAWNEKGRFVLPQQAQEILGAGHPYIEEVVKDLIDLCHHPNAGTLTISGWRSNDQPLSFPFENGAHAGPGMHETDAFALLPASVKRLSQERPYLRTKDLRELALRALKRIPEPFPASTLPSLNRLRSSGTVRVMTYNVHSCVGMDGKVSPLRIAKVIGRYEPDIVLLQELDIGRRYTAGMDQPHLIAKELEMLYHFHPSIQIAEEQYGNAVLSRYPMTLIHAAQLPGLKNNFNTEPRGAIWVSVKVGDVHLQVINTHLSFHASECRHQIEALMGSEWIRHPRCVGPVICCGDFNCLPNSAGWRTISHQLDDAQHALDKHRPLATWFGHYPIGRIDHIFISPGVKVVAVDVPRTKLNKISSDHLPLIVDLEVF